MGSGGSGAGAGGGGYSGGGLANTGGTGYGGDLGGYGTAGEMSGGAGGAAMGGFGNTGAGGSGMAGVSSMSGMTPPGFTPAFGDPRGASIGMDAFGNYKGTPGYAGIGAPGKPTTMSPKSQVEMFGYVKYPSSVVPPTSFSTAIPTQTAAMQIPAPDYKNPSMLRYGLPMPSWGPRGVNPYPPGLPTPNNRPGFPGSPHQGTIGKQTGVQSTFGPGNYGNSGLMSGNPVGSGLSVGLGNRVAAAGVSGGTNRNMGNVVGGSGGGMTGRGSVGGKSSNQ